MSFPYKCVLMIGATSGIGAAMASRMAKQGKTVLVVGRREDRLEKFVQEHGSEKATAYPFDISKIDKIPGFAKHITDKHPQLDCVFLNSGIQRLVDFSKPDSVNIDSIQEEMQLNYTCHLALTKAFLPFLQAKSDPSSLVYTTSGLAMVPLPAVMNYSASKAALHSFIICLREQLKSSPQIRVTEVFPPLVQTELHDEKNQPGRKGDRVWGMPLDAFTDKAYEGLSAGKEEVPVGMAARNHESIEGVRQKAFHGMMAAMAAAEAGK